MELHGVLYVCPTPIGNLEDITLRALRILQEVDLVLAEDTRHSRRLLAHFEISTPLQSFHEHNEKAKTVQILEMLRGGRRIALISDAGMPGISDPGIWLIQQVIEHDLSLEVLPGANAALVGFLQSGFCSSHFLFYGFLPRRSTERLNILSRLHQIEVPAIFYEAPHRLEVMLADLFQVFGNRRISISRELTKRFEETKRGSIEELLEFYKSNRPQGEFVVVVEGSLLCSKAEIMTEDDIYSALQTLLADGLSRRTAIAQISTKYRLPKNRVYEIALRSETKD